MTPKALADTGIARRGILVALLGLAGCGFRPLYGEGTPAAAMTGRVEVAMLDGAPGFAMRERLTQRLGPPAAPTHRLETALTLNRTGVALTQENVTTRYDVTGVATYRLVPLAGGPPVAAGSVRTVTGYSATRMGSGPKSSTAATPVSGRARKRAASRPASFTTPARPRWQR